MAFTKKMRRRSSIVTGILWSQIWLNQRKTKEKRKRKKKKKFKSKNRWKRPLRKLWKRLRGLRKPYSGRTLRMLIMGRSGTRLKIKAITSSKFSTINSLITRSLGCWRKKREESWPPSRRIRPKKPIPQPAIEASKASRPKKVAKEHPELRSRRSWIS